MDRSALATIAEETMEILRVGGYDLPSGGRVDLAAEIVRCVTGSNDWQPDELAQLERRVLGTAPQWAETTFAVFNESSLAGAAALAQGQRFHRVGLLNFASARRPGGGFLNGAAAQEESLARSSALYASLAQFPDFYAVHRRLRDPRYSDRMIYSPGCPVFRDDAGSLLRTPYAVDFITSAAPNAGALSRRNSRAGLRAILKQRAGKLLALACDQGCDALLLGAWGCGVFRNDPEVVSGVFGELLLPGGAYFGRFAHLRFSVFSTGEDQTNYLAFAVRFSETGPATRSDRSS